MFFCQLQEGHGRDFAALHSRLFLVQSERCVNLTGQPRVPGGLPDISWYGALGGSVPWNYGLDRSLSCLLSAVPPTKEYEGSLFHILIMFHGGWESREFYFPAVCQNFSWRLFIDTAADSPNDVYPERTGPKPNLNAPLRFLPHAMRVYLAEVK